MIGALVGQIASHFNCYQVTITVSEHVSFNVEIVDTAEKQIEASISRETETSKNKCLELAELIHGSFEFNLAFYELFNMSIV